MTTDTIEAPSTALRCDHCGAPVRWNRDSRGRYVLLDYWPTDAGEWKLDSRQVLYPASGRGQRWATHRCIEARRRAVPADVDWNLTRRDLA